MASQGTTRTPIFPTKTVGRDLQEASILEEQPEDEAIQVQRHAQRGSTATGSAQGTRGAGRHRGSRRCLGHSEPHRLFCVQRLPSVTRLQLRDTQSQGRELRRAGPGGCGAAGPGRALPRAHSNARSPGWDEQLGKALALLRTSPRCVPAPLSAGERAATPGRGRPPPPPADPPCAACRGTAPWRRRGGARPCAGRGAGPGLGLELGPGPGGAQGPQQQQHRAHGRARRSADGTAERPAPPGRGTARSPTAPRPHRLTGRRFARRSRGDVLHPGDLRRARPHSPAALRSQGPQ